MSGRGWAGFPLCVSVLAALIVAGVAVYWPVATGTDCAGLCESPRTESLATDPHSPDSSPITADDGGGDAYSGPAKPFMVVASTTRLLAAVTVSRAAHD